MKKIALMLLSMALIGVLTIEAQVRRISGTVISADDRNAIPGASVVVKGTTLGTITNLNGEYQLDVPTDASTLIFSFVGMKTIEQPAEGSVVNVMMEQDVIGMDEIVVTGYGVTRKVAFTGAATTVDEAVVTRTTDADPIRSLEGAVAGLAMSAETGQPGGFNSVLIRGLGSFNSGTQPLYIIDGVPVSSGAFGMRTGESQTINPLATLNPNDIESISILKDATATSIYGARASNGVIVISTKKGATGTTRFNMNVKSGVSNIPQRNDYRQLDAQEWRDFLGHMFTNTGWIDNLNEFDDSFLTDPDWLGIVNIDSDTDWYDEVTRTGVIQDYNLEVSGGNDNSKFFFSGGYYDEEGIVIGKDMKRYSGRFNFENAANNYVSFGLNFTASYSEINSGAGGGFFSDPITQAYMQLPVEPVKLPDGSWNMNTANGYNPVAQRSYYGDKSFSQQYKALVSPWLSVKFLNNFTFITRYGIDFFNLKEFGRWSFLQPQGADMNMLGEEGNNYRSLWTWTNTLNYLKSMGDHNINVLLGQEAQKSRDEDSYLAGSNFPVDIVFTIENAAEPSDAATSYADYALSSFFSKAEYDFKNKYYLSGSFRYDGSSRFGINNKWAPFWSAGAKYRVINEPFMEGISGVINNFTIRASYGTSGNQDVAWYQHMGLYGFGYNYMNNPGMIPTQIANPDLKWEQTKKFNIGTEIGLFNFASFDVDYYIDRTTDMLFNVPLSRTTGFASIMQNIGEMKNSGIEANLIINAINSKDLQWSLNINATHNKNEIVKLSTDLPIEGTFTIREVGLPFYSFKMREYAGVDPETGSQLWYKGVEGTETTKSYNEAGKRYMGAADPKVYGGFGSNLRAYNFDFSFQFKYSLGGQVYNSAARYDENINNPWGNTTKYVYDNMWRQAGDVTDVPAPRYGAVTSHSSRFLMDGSYIKLKSVQLGYSIPESLISKANISNLRLFVSGDNLVSWALGEDFRGLDPETARDGIIWWQYPIARKFLFGVNISF